MGEILNCSEIIKEMYRTFSHERALSLGPNYAAKGLYRDWLLVELNDPWVVECLKKSRDQKRKDILGVLTKREKEQIFGARWRDYGIE